MKSGNGGLVEEDSTVSDYTLDYQVQPSTLVKFWLTGDDLQPDVLSATLGVVPFAAWTKGEAIVRRGHTLPAVRIRGAWCLEPGTTPDQPFEVQLRQLLDRLEALPSILQEFVQVYAGVISVGMSSGEGHFGLFIDHTAMERLCRLGVAIGFDLYTVSDGGDPNSTTNGSTGVTGS